MAGATVAAIADVVVIPTLVMVTPVKPALVMRLVYTADYEREATNAAVVSAEAARFGAIVNLISMEVLLEVFEVVFDVVFEVEF